MFVQSSLEIPFDFPAVRVALHNSPRAWLQPLAEEAQARRERLLGLVGVEIGRSPGRLHVELGGFLVDELTVSLPFWVRVENAEEWPQFDSVLTAAWLGYEHTQLELEGRYEPPAGLSWREQVLFHRVVQAVSRHFLVGVATALGERLSPKPRGPGLERTSFETRFDWPVR